MSSLELQVFPFSNETMSIGPQLESVPVKGSCAQGVYTGAAVLGLDPEQRKAAPWVVTKLMNTGASGLGKITLGVVYHSDGAPQ